MPTPSTLRSAEYRIVVISSRRELILTFSPDGMRRLPRLKIPQGARPSRHIQAAIQSLWGISVFVIDFLSMPRADGACVVAEFLSESIPSSVATVSVNDLDPGELSEAEESGLRRMLAPNATASISRVGWVDEAMAWVADMTGERGLSKCGIEQHNAGGGFSLLRMRSVSRGSYWLKATDFPNTHERTITSTLVRVCRALPGCSSFVPELLAERADWNAWLMRETAGLHAVPQGEVDSLKATSGIASTLAALQQATLPHTAELLSNGACDHRYARLRSMGPSLFAHLQTVLEDLDGSCSRDAERLRVSEEASLEILERLEASPIPSSIVHGDLNWGNILLGPSPQFIDWSEAYIGNPATSLYQLVALFRSASPEIGDRLASAAEDAYVSAWKGLSAADWRENLRYARATHILTLLFGRFDWASSNADIPGRDSRYLRFLTERLYDAVASQMTVAA